MWSKSGSMVTGCPDRPEHRMQISHRDATLRPNLSPKLHARQPKLVYSELFRASLGQIGPDRRRLVDGFERTTAKTAYPLVKGHNTEYRKSILCSPDSYLSPLSKPRGGQRPGYGDHLWQMAGRLLIAESLRLDTTRVIAMCSDTKVLSNVWWPIRVESSAHEKALVVWLNSSPGLLTILAERTSTEGAWVATKKADLEGLPVLDPRRLFSFTALRLF